MKTLYLAGPIFGCSDQEARGWRQAAKLALAGDWEFSDPMDRDYRGHESGLEAEIVVSDMIAISESDALLVNALRPSWGTAMEIRFAREQGKTVVAFAEGALSPWLKFHAIVLHSLEEACCYLTEVG